MPQVTRNRDLLSLRDRTSATTTALTVPIAARACRLIDFRSCLGQGYCWVESEWGDGGVLLAGREGGASLKHGGHGQHVPAEEEGEEVCAGPEAQDPAFPAREACGAAGPPGPPRCEASTHKPTQPQHHRRMPKHISPHREAKEKVRTKVCRC